MASSPNIRNTIPPRRKYAFFHADIIKCILNVFPIFLAVYYLPAATLLFQWFQEKRGLAAGIVFSGTGRLSIMHLNTTLLAYLGHKGVGGATWPFIMQSLLNHFGYQAALISLVCVASRSPSQGMNDANRYTLTAGTGLRCFRCSVTALRKTPHPCHTAF
jgi:hypothetical protein